jgi:ribosomal protein S18 acetylase RimI-like enzyme
VSEELIKGYWLRPGLAIDEPKLVRFMCRTYEELYPEQDFGHLAKTINQYFSSQTPLWWVEWEEEGDKIKDDSVNFLPSSFRNSSPIVGCLWLGNAIDQVTGDRHAYIFLLYIVPEHRRRGLGKALVTYAENWARKRGDKQLGLQVFFANAPALNLYKKLGYETRSLWMLKSLD